MRRFAGIFIAALLLLATGITTLAQPGPSREGYQTNMIWYTPDRTATLADPGLSRERPRRMGHQDFGLVRMLHDPSLRTKFGITNEQYDKLKATFLDSSKAAIRDQADLKIKRLELANLMDGDKVDRAQVNQKIDELTASQAALMKSQIGTRLAVKEILTPDQLSKIREWRQSQARRFMENRTQRGMGMMQGPQRPGMRRQSTPPQQPPAPPKPGDSSSQ